MEDSDFTDEAARARWAKEVTRSVTAIHRAGVLHNDLRQVHMLKCPQTNRVIVIDFERATLRPLVRFPMCPTKAKVNRQSGLCNLEEARDKVKGGFVKTHPLYQDWLAGQELSSAERSCRDHRQVQQH